MRGLCPPRQTITNFFRRPNNALARRFRDVVLRRPATVTSGTGDERPVHTAFRLPGGRARRATSGKVLVEPPSAIIISRAGRAWPNKLPTSVPRKCPQLYPETITETEGCRMTAHYDMSPV